MSNYEYNVKIVSIHDGDTLRADLDLGQEVQLPAGSPEAIDLGLRVWLLLDPLTLRHRLWLRGITFRLNRINTPEITGVQKPLGIASKAFVLTKLQLGQTVPVRTFKDEEEKYGRYLADLYPDGYAGYCLNDLLVEQGFAKYYDGQGPKPI